ncbi:hypothetical protein C8Q76DRAFT_798304 [Earliella scabrosa]|nr:hypothetical protein C8Q76DRAFT_798304 [Earliella scabrosa]
MPLHRDYFRPEEPGARPVFKVTAAKQKTYPATVKLMCQKGASERMPQPPTQCPRCAQDTPFFAQICYMPGVAGAYVLVGTRCSHRHWPIQRGPSETHLREIEEERQRCVGTPLREQGERVVALLTRTHGVVKARVNNRIQISKDIVEKKRLKHLAQKDAPNSQLVTRTRKRAALETSNNYELAGATTSQGKEDDNARATVVGHGGERLPYESDLSHAADCAGPRTATIVLWFKAGAAPQRREWGVSGYCNEHSLCLDEMAWVYVHGQRFDFWSYDLAQWMRIGSSHEDIPVNKDNVTVFMRVRGVIPVEFPTELRQAEVQSGWMQRVSPTEDAIGPPLTGRLWILLWVEDHCGPEVFCISCPQDNLLRITQTESYVAGLMGLEGARAMAYWDEGEGQWEAMDVTDTLTIDPTAPVLLLRRQDAFYIRGLGDALLYLTSYRKLQEDRMIAPSKVQATHRPVAKSVRLLLFLL